MGRLLGSIGILGFAFVIEMVGSYWSLSQALFADALHVSMDMVALAIGLMGFFLTRWPATVRKTYGWYGAPTLAAWTNAVLLLVLGLLVLYGSVRRIWAQEEITTKTMLVAAAVGLIANGICWVLFRSHPEVSRDLNMRAAFAHVIADTWSSLAVIGAGALMALTGWAGFDGIFGFGIGGYMLWRAFLLGKESGHEILLGTPSGVDVEALRRELGVIPGVQSVADLHVWALTAKARFGSAHLVVGPGLSLAVWEAIRAEARRAFYGFEVYHPTIEPEEQHEHGPEAEKVPQGI